MATITRRATRDGGEAWTARIRRSRRGQGTHSEARTFPTEVEAKGWAVSREREIAATPEFRDLAAASPRRNPTVGEAIERYLAMKRDLSKSKRCVLRVIRDFPIGSVKFADLDAARIVDFAQAKREAPVQPQTVTRYLAELSVVLQFARIYWNAPVDRSVMGDAWQMAVKLGICGKSHRRDRRPTLKELDRLMAWFKARSGTRPTAVPMTRIVAFAIFSTRRRGEICRIRWDDLDRRGRQVLVRDMKHPGARIGNNVVCDLPDPATAIAAAMPRREARIFPFEPDTISALWSRACREAKVRNLHFHDLRHEGVSRLFELGWNVPRVMQVSGHRNMASVQRYTHLDGAGDKFDDWAWIPEVVEPQWVKEARA